MSKRFPIPEFDRDRYKNLPWTQPKLLTVDECDRVLAAARSGNAAAYRSYPVAADAALYERFKLAGDHRHAVLCVLPPGPAKVVGRSWAWPIQRALLVDSLDAKAARVLHEWKTPRPMNTRLGPQDGVEVAGPVFALFGHLYADHWIANRTLTQSAQRSRGFDVLSSSDEATNDFHACNLAFSWS